MSQARNLMLLAIEAYTAKKFDSAGTLFAASLSSEDAQEFIDTLQVEQEIQTEQTATASAVEPGAHQSLSQIASAVATAMSAEAADDEGDDEDEDEEDEPDGEEDSDGEDEDGDGADDDEDDDGDTEEEDEDADDEDGSDGEDEDGDDGDDPDALPSSISGEAPVRIIGAGSDAAPVKPRVLISMGNSPVKLKGSAE